MVYKELKMKFNALFVCNYRLIHTHFNAICCNHIIKVHLKADWEMIFALYLH